MTEKYLILFLKVRYTFLLKYLLQDNFLDQYKNHSIEVINHQHS